MCEFYPAPHVLQQVVLRVLFELDSSIIRCPTLYNKFYSGVYASPAAFARVCMPERAVPRRATPRHTAPRAAPLRAARGARRTGRAATRAAERAEGAVCCARRSGVPSDGISAGGAARAVVACFIAEEFGVGNQQRGGFFTLYPTPGRPRGARSSAELTRMSFNFVFL